MSTNFRQYRDESRKNYGRHLEEGVGMNDEGIKLGAILRIADATEKMAQRHTELIRERDNYKRDSEYWRRQFDQMERSRRALKGQLTKLKKGGAA